MVKRLYDFMICHCLFCSHHYKHGYSMAICLNRFCFIFSLDDLLYILFQLCFQVGGLDPKPPHGSICRISGWRMEMSKGCCGQV